jgi:Flp pilus assembly protein TadB
MEPTKPAAKPNAQAEKKITVPANATSGLKTFLRPITSVIISYASKLMLLIAGVVIGSVELSYRLMTKTNRRFVKFSEGFRMNAGGKFSKKTRRGVGMLVVYAGLTRNPEEILGVVLIYCLALAAIGGLATYILLEAFGGNFMGLPYLLVMALGLTLPVILTWLVFFVVFMVIIDRRTSSIEKVLPDVLTIISQNMIAGMTVYNSLWSAARPEFGPFAIELQSVAKETLGGEPFDKSLMAMSGRINSYKLARSIKLMIQGMKSGGELPTVLQEIATDIRAEQALYKKMSSQTTSQVMFILFALLIGAPLLFAASFQFVNIFHMIYTRIGFDPNSASSSMSSGMIQLQDLTISPDFFYNYAIITLIMLGVLGALLIGLIKSGKLSTGVPYVPVLPTLSVLIFIGLSSVLVTFFGGMMGAG